MSGNVGEGNLYELIYDDSTFATHHRNLALVYTGVDQTCETFDASAWAAANAIQFAGIAFTDFPYQTMSGALTGAYTGTSYSVPYDDRPAADLITVQHRVRTHAIPAEDIVAGDLIMMTDVADHGVGDEHDGMVSPADVGTANEMYATIGVAETAFDVPVTHTLHEDAWDQNDGQFTTVHEYFWIQLWR